VLLQAASIFILVVTTSLCEAQSTIRGIVRGGNNEPLPDATVLLLNVKDSSLVKGSMSTSNGSFLFEKVTTGHYFVRSSYTGYKDAFSAPFISPENEEIQLTTLVLSEKEEAMTAVNVIAKKPLYEQKIDRMVINVAASITNTGTTVLDVLMRSPGVVVDQRNNSISMNGKEGVVIMLNGKISRMPLSSVVQMLAGMSSSNIEKIELITTPPANLDAEGNAGFINIVMKTSTQYGTNGSYSATLGHGIGSGAIAMGSINFNHRKGNINLYGDYSFAWAGLDFHGTIYRKTVNGATVTTNYMETRRDDFRRNHNGRVGLDYELNQKTVVGILVSGFANMYGMEEASTSNTYVNQTKDTLIRMLNDERHPLDNYSVNINLTKQLQPTQQLTFNFDHVYFRDANTVNYLYDYYDGSEAFIYQQQIRSGKETPIRFWVGTADYTHKIGAKVSVEAGIKATVSRFENHVHVEKEVQDHWSEDKSFTGQYELDESIGAAYSSFNIEFNERTHSKAGVRYEYTNSNLGSQAQKNIVDRQYGNWFPSLFVSHKLNDQHALHFSYSRRITRPTFNDMAPFVYFVDPNTFFSGNPALQPATSNAVKVDYLFKSFILSFSFTKEKNTITNFAPRVDPVTNTLTILSENQKDQSIAAVTVSLPLQVTPWWSMQNSLSGQWVELNAVYKGSPLVIEQKNFSYNFTQSFVLPKEFALEVSGYYQSASLFGIYKLQSMQSVNVGLQKKLGPRKGVLRFAVNDVFGPPHLRFSVDAPEHNLVTHGDFRFSNSNIRLTYTRNFGSEKVKERRMRGTGSEEERQRVQ
jgi:hypothetical protein